PRGRDRLIHALAARADREPGRAQRLAGPHEARHAHGDVDVQASDDGDVAHRHFGSPGRSAGQGKALGLARPRRYKVDMSTTTVVEVAVPVPVDETFDYALVDERT